MKKISFLLLCCFCNLSVWAQENQLRSTGNLVQDSVRTRIVNGKPETIFYVKATASESFPISFWLMGVRHVNGTYSIYTLKVDNDSIGQVLTDRGDWHSYRPSNINSVYLTQGSHTISISGTLNDVPNAECVKKTCIIAV